MKCTDCPYWWNDHDFDPEGEDRPRCHYAWDDGYAPCEVEEGSEEE